MMAKAKTIANGKKRAGKTGETKTKNPGSTGRRARFLPPEQCWIILDRIHDGIVVFDAEMNYVYVNKRGGELLGRKAKDLIGKNYWVEYPEAKGTPFAEAYVRALETQETIVLENYYAPFDRWFENRIFPSKEGLTIFFTEITERKKAEQIVRESQERLTLAIRSANVGLWDWDLQTNKVQYSPEWKGQLGYEDREISDDFSEWESRVHPEDLERAKATVSSYIEKPYPNFHNEFRMRHKDGLYRWILAQASLLFDERGTPIRMIGSHIDITERKQAEEELRENEEKFRLLTDYSIQGVALFQDNILTYVNPTYGEISNYSNEELLGSSVEHVMKTVYPQDRPILLERQARFQRGDDVKELAEFRIVRKGGEIRWVRGTTKLATLHGKPARLVMVVDITDRKRAEEIIQVSQRQLSTLIGNLPGVVFRVRNDPNYTTEYVSDQIAELTGYPADDFRENRRNFGKLMHPDDREWVWNETQKALGEHRPYQLTYRFIDAKGQEKWNWERGRGVFDAIGELQAVEGFVQDITERKRAEEELRLSQERFFNAFHTSPAGLTITRIADGKFIEANESFCRMFEFSREEVIGHTSTELNMWTPEERKKLIDEQIKSGGLENFELQARSKSGRVVNLLFSSKPMELAGEPHHITTLTDITERKQAEERIAYQANLLANVNDAVIASDENFVLTSWNHAAERIYGWTAEEVIGKPGAEILQTEFLSISRPEAIKQLIESGEYLAEVINPRKDGVKIYIETRATALRDPNGKTVGYVSINRDITERKRAEADLRQSNERFAIAFNSSPAGIAITRIADGIYIDVNEVLCTMLGYAREEMIGRSAAELGALSAAERQKVIDILKIRKTIRNAEIGITHRSGKQLDVLYSMELIEVSGETWAIATMIDITERKQAQEEIRLSRDRLADLSRRLVEAHETESRAIGRELHDQIGQMLTALKLTIEIAMQMPPEQAHQKALQGKALIEELLNRVSALSLELRPPMLDDLGLASALLWHVNRFQEQTQIEVDFHHSGVEGKRFGPEIETTAYRVVQETFTNVARHARATRIRIEVRTRGGQMEIQIEDNGTGFDPQVAFAKHRGLSAMRERVQLLGGAFQVESQIGKGARKIIRLPLKADP